jgi:hypothetical protein
VRREQSGYSWPCRVSRVTGWPPEVGCAGRADRKGEKWAEATTGVGRVLKRNEEEKRKRGVGSVSRRNEDSA